MISDRIERAIQLSADGKSREAVLLLQEITRLFPAQASGFVLLARELTTMGKLGLAWEAWSHAHFLVPESTVVTNNRRSLARLLLQKAGTSGVETGDGRMSELEAVARGGRSGYAGKKFETCLDEDLGDGVFVDMEVNFNWESESVHPYPEISWKSLEKTLEQLEPKNMSQPTVGPEALVDDGKTGDMHPELEGVADLDELISQLQNAPRIMPAREDAETYETAEQDSIDDMVSETLARIYAGQKQYEDAVAVYEKLAQQQPARATYFQERANELRAKQ